MLLTSDTYLHVHLRDVWRARAGAAQVVDARAPQVIDHARPVGAAREDERGRVEQNESARERLHPRLAQRVRPAVQRVVQRARAEEVHPPARVARARHLRDGGARGR